MKFDDLNQTVDGKQFTHNEYKLLRYLVANKNRVVSRQQILKDVWGYEFGDMRTINVTICRLRKKIGDHITTQIGSGYIFSP
jgi:DNA-binding response OmpR family regulator